MVQRVNSFTQAQLKRKQHFVAPVLYSSRAFVARVTQVLGTRLKLRRLQRLDAILEGPASIKMTSKGRSARREVSTMKCINYLLLPEKTLKEPLIMKFVKFCVILPTREDNES